MKEVSGFPYFEVQFDKEGRVHLETEKSQLLNFLAQAAVTDLLVISHGWNNDMGEARKIYDEFLACLRKELNKQGHMEVGKRKFTILGILWPSKKFAEEDQIPSGAAGFDAPDEKEQMLQQLESLKGVFDHFDADAILEQAKSLVPNLETDPNAPIKFAELIRSLPSKHELHADDASDLFFKVPADELMDTLSRPDLPTPASGDIGGAAVFGSSEESTIEGGAAGFDIFGGIIAAARKVLNYTTYIQMKERAGIVGRSGVNRLLQEIREQEKQIRERQNKDKFSKLKIHLIGHSFGGRLVTAAADGPEGKPPVRASSVTLLQAAFSHNSFAQKFDGERDGFFRKVVIQDKVVGPILITHSSKDWAVGKAYPIASKFSGDDAAGIGGPDDRFGGIGRNGAQKTPEADNSMMLGPVTSAYSFKPGKLYNLKADTIIKGHNDIVKNEIAHVLLCAIEST